MMRGKMACASGRAEIFRQHWSKVLVVTVGGSTLLLSPALHAQETTTYTYDALGRVTGVNRSGGPASGTNTSYSYDPASNRTNVTVSNSPNGSSNSSSGSGATSPTVKYVVVPLNGFTVIQFQM